MRAQARTQNTSQGPRIHLTAPRHSGILKVFNPSDAAVPLCLLQRLIPKVIGSLPIKAEWVPSVSSSQHMEHNREMTGRRQMEVGRWRRKAGVMFQDSWTVKRKHLGAKRTAGTWQKCTLRLKTGSNRIFNTWLGSHRDQRTRVQLLE